MHYARLPLSSKQFNILYKAFSVCRVFFCRLIIKGPFFGYKTALLCPQMHCRFGYNSPQE